MYLDSHSNFLNIDPEYSQGKAEINILQSPYEHTVSYGGGTALGPQAVLEASAYVEFFDDETKKELCFEKGIATCPPMEFKDSIDSEALDIIYNAVRSSLSEGKFAVTLGGEHTISSAVIKAHLESYPDMGVLQIDAHSDLRDTYEGSKYSHASIMARVAEFLDPTKIHQVGIRALCSEEYKFITENNVNTYFASAIRQGDYGEDWISRLVDKLPQDIYLTFDVDGLDPSIMPSTGTPEPEGLYYTEATDIIRTIKKAGKRIVGFDVVELAPIQGVTHPDILTARLIYKILNLIYYYE
jgi:agmatinase